MSYEGASRSMTVTPSDRSYPGPLYNKILRRSKQYFVLKTYIFCKQLCPCALCVRRENLTHKVIRVKVFTLSVYSCLSQLCKWVPWQKSVDSGNCVNFRNVKILQKNICSFEKYGSMFQKYFDWSQLFSVKKVHIIFVPNRRERCHFMLLPLCLKVQSKCFQMFSFFEELEASSHSWTQHDVAGAFPVFPNPWV